MYNLIFLSSRVSCSRSSSDGSWPQAPAAPRPSQGCRARALVPLPQHPGQGWHGKHPGEGSACQGGQARPPGQVLCCSAQGEGTMSPRCIERELGWDSGTLEDPVSPAPALAPFPAHPPAQGEPGAGTDPSSAGTCTGGQLCINIYSKLPGNLDAV